MANYNLNDNAAESFKFSLGGHEYTLRYPSTEEIEQAGKLKEEEVENWLYQFVKSPEGAPPIKEALRKHNVKVLSNFRKMIEAEFGLE